jgi:hypothetical protein
MTTMTRRHRQGFYVLVSAAFLSVACGSSDSTGGGGGAGGSGGVTGTGGSSGSGGVSASGGIGGASASGGTAGSGGLSGSSGTGGAAGAAGIPSDLGKPCNSGACSPGLTPVSYCGFAGCSAGTFCSCEIPCDKDPTVCPAGTSCATVSDGPGTVCVK